MSDTEPIISPRKVRIVGSSTSKHQFPLQSVVLLTGGPDVDGDFVGTGTSASGFVDWWYLKPADFVEVPGSTPLGLPEPKADPVEPEGPEPTAMYDQPEPLPVPEPALKVALLEDHDTHATAEDQSRDVLRRELAAAVGNSSYDVSPMLAAVDRYVDSLPQAQVEYVSAPLMDGLRSEALNHAVGIAKVSTNLGNMEATDTAGIVAQAEAFHTFLTDASQESK